MENIELNVKSQEKYKRYLEIMYEMAPVWKKEFLTLSDEIAKAYALAIVFYTGLPNNEEMTADRVNRDSNALLKAQAE